VTKKPTFGDWMRHTRSIIARNFWLKRSRYVDDYGGRLWFDEYFEFKDWELAVYSAGWKYGPGGGSIVPQQLILDEMLKWWSLPLWYRITVPITRFLYRRGWLPRDLRQRWRDRNQTWPQFRPRNDEDVPF
jgi:hypothetical protein